MGLRKSPTVNIVRMRIEAKPIGEKGPMWGVKKREVSG
jgi:hypothetical protein